MPQRHVLLAYSPEDREKAKRLYDDLVKAGIRVTAGENGLDWLKSISRPITVQDVVCVVYCLSRRKAPPRWHEMLNEIKLGHLEFTPSITIIPVQINMDDIPLLLSKDRGIKWLKPIVMHRSWNRSLRRLLGKIETLPLCFQSDERDLNALLGNLPEFSRNKSYDHTLRLMAQCAPGPIPFDFLARLLGTYEEKLERQLKQLCARTLCLQVDGEDKAFELSARVREILRDRETDTKIVNRFLDLVQSVYTDKKDETHYSKKDRWLPQAREAVQRLDEMGDSRLTKWADATFWRYCDSRGHGKFYLDVTNQIIRRFPGDRYVHAECYFGQASILRDWGKLEEAMMLFKKQQELQEELGNHAALAASYGHQALILKAQGKLEEAMALHQKEQALQEELGNRAGLSASYGNQALILRAWGKLDKAMALHKKAQALIEKSGDRAALAISYNNQAEILRDLGKLDEAMKLHKQVKAISLDTGIKEHLAESYINQALILSDWGRHDEAMVQHQKGHAIFGESGLPLKLAESTWNRGEILGKQGKREEMLAHYQSAIDQKKKYDYATDEWDRKLAEALKADTPPEPLSPEDLLDLLYLLVLDRRANPELLIALQPDQLKDIVANQSPQALLQDLKTRHRDRPDPLWRQWTLARNETAFHQLAGVLQA
ncbi:MAG: toll/interleukin-1 receptor domain-containing protein [Acidobacteriota bacterium]|nr:toll/interleukin-1 receptor domain-containing protein [Acidobacteriota bacterium]